ncbi:MAG: aldo/keto reductase, partial [Bacteroidetes bacterium]
MSNIPYIAGTMRWGTWGANFSTAQYCKAIQHCLEQGITCFDGADIYGHYTTEAAFGKALAEMGLERDKYQIISKAGILLPNAAPYFAQLKHYNTSKAHLISAVQRSLQDLQTDYLDIFLVHRPSPLMHLQEVAEALTYLLQNGLVKKVGVSNFSFEQVELLSSYLPLDCHQFECSLWRPQAFTNGVLHQC